MTYEKCNSYFYDTIRACALEIDRLGSVEKKILFTEKLDTVFILKNYTIALKFYKELVDTKKDGDLRG